MVVFITGGRWRPNGGLRSDAIRLMAPGRIMLLLGGGARCPLSGQQMSVR